MYKKAQQSGMATSCVEHTVDESFPTKSREELVRLAFGDSSESDSDDENLVEAGDGGATAIVRLSNTSHLSENSPPTVLNHPRVPGLHQVKGFLSAAEQAAVIHFAQGMGWLSSPETYNQAMMFGELPGWLKPTLQSASQHAVQLWPHTITRREPLFNQLIMNLYQPGEGITPHVDLMRFQDGIANISFLSSCVMGFRGVSTGGEASGEQDEAYEVLLEPGDLLLLHGSARYEYTHGIRRCREETWGAERRSVTRALRMSLTLRCLVEDKGEGDGEAKRY
mmetsp:Transcript_17191/g.30711  ORF Transcript_17191/g.30711 Transcript_17191/m.30711 type:complete len:280 (-) Transcript_17191:1-840(-)